MNKMGVICHQFAGLGIEDLCCLSVVPIVEPMPLRRHAQFFQPLPHLVPARVASFADVTAWTVDSQER
jgi:hypothetical protein